MNLAENLIKDIEYLAEQEEFNLAMRDGCKKGSFEYDYHQRLFGTYFRARVRAERELKTLQIGEG